MFDGFAWGIAPWDTDKVKAELDKRGLNPIADHAGSDYKSFRVKDPDGFDLAITNGTKALRRKTPANGKLPAPAPFEPTGWNTLYLDHISFEVPDYRRSAAFYQALLGWDVRPGGGGASGDGADRLASPARSFAGTRPRARRSWRPRRRRRFGECRRRRRRLLAAAGEWRDGRDRAYQFWHRELGYGARARRAEEARRGLREPRWTARAAAGHDRDTRELPCAGRDGLGSSDRKQDRAGTLAAAEAYKLWVNYLVYAFTHSNYP